MEKKLDFNKILFYGALGVITVLFATLILVFAIGKVRTVDKMKQINYSDLYTQKESTYYVYIYATDQARNDWYDDIVVEYANYSRTHSSATKIYAYDFNAQGNSRITNELSGSVTLGKEIPGLIKIENGKISEKYLSYTKLNNELTKAMKK